MKAEIIHACFETLPFADLDVIAPGATLIVAPHADDESLGTGGFIAEACARGRPPVVVIATDGAASHLHSQLWPPNRLVQRRQAETLDAARTLGLPPERLFFLNLPDTAVPHEGPLFEKTVDHLAQIATSHGCTTLLTSWQHDPHCDHLAVARMGQAFQELTGLAHLSYPVWGLTLPPDYDIDQTPINGWRLDIARHLPAKRAAIAAHATQNGHLIQDDPTGFSLPPFLLDRIVRPYEIFFSHA